MRRLLVLGCSATKTIAPGYVPARERYDGPLWQTMRTHERDDAGRVRAKVAFLSAEYGFEEQSAPILDYNRRMTPQRAQEMIAGGMTKRWPVVKPGRAGGIHPACVINSMALGRDLELHPFDDVAFCAGELYLLVLEAFLPEFKRLGCVTPDARVTIINAPIGVMRQRLRAWLEEGLCDVH